MKVVIDSNIFVMCMSPRSDYHIIFQKLFRGDFTMCITTDIAFEYIEVFQAKFNHTKYSSLIKFLHESKYVEVSEIFFKWNLVFANADDNKYVDCYIASNADYLVTNDKHFNKLSENDFPSVNCINIDEFVNLLNN